VATATLIIVRLLTNPTTKYAGLIYFSVILLRPTKIEPEGTMEWFRRYFFSVGSWGLCIICTDMPDVLVVACNGITLVIGVADYRTFIASETPAFNRYTHNMISMKNGEIGVLHSDCQSLDQSRKQKAPRPARYPLARHVSPLDPQGML
jgi:hypothetical protein